MEPLSRRDALRLAAANLALSGVAARAATESEAAPPAAPAAAPLPKTLDLIFEGGGMKGAAFAGALAVLEQRGYRYRRLIGTSAGAIAAACVAAGYDAEGLSKLLATLDLGRLMKSPASIPAPEGISALKWFAFQKAMQSACAAFDLKKEGERKLDRETAQEHVRRGLALYSTGAMADDAGFLEFMSKALAGMKLKEGIRLGEFHERTKARGIQLSLIASDVTAHRVLVLNHLTAPQVPVVQAVRMSMGVPFVWKEVVWQRDWGETYRGARPMLDKGEGHRVVDGGVLSNFPMRFVLDPKHSLPEGVLGVPPVEGAAGVLGLLLDEQKPVPGVDAQEVKARFGEQIPAVQTAMRLAETMTGTWDAEAIEEYQAEKYICRIGVQGFSTFDFEIDEKGTRALAESGRMAMEAHLAPR